MSDKKKIIVFSIILIICVPTLLTFIHEGGHALVSLFFGWEVTEIKLSYFPFLLELEGAYTMIHIPENAETWKVYIMLLSGSLSTALFGILFFLLFYKCKLNRFLELTFYTYSIAFILDFTLYFYLDIFFFKFGDFHQLFEMNSIILGIIGLIYYSLFITAVVNRKRILKKVDFYYYS